MRIKVTEKLQPFSHLPGASCLLPGSSLQLQLFPTLIRLHDLSGDLSSPHLLTEITLDIVGPVKNFTVLLDTEKGVVRVWGDSSKGYFRYTVHALSQHGILALEMEKVPQGGLSVSAAAPYHVYRYLHDLFVTQDVPSQPKEVLFISCHGNDIHDRDYCHMQKSEQLSLGNHKAQDWDMVRRRVDLKEIFPLWLRLAELFPNSKEAKDDVGTYKLLDACRTLVEKGKREQLHQAFCNLFLAGFHHLMVPRLLDNDHQGLVPQTALEMEIETTSPLPLLHKSAALIRELFVRHDQKSNTTYLLPALPVELHCGRFINVAVKGLSIDFEWSKKSIKRVVIRALQSDSFTFVFQKHVKSLRIRQNKQIKGETAKIDPSKGVTIPLEAGQTYLLDCFE